MVEMFKKNKVVNSEEKEVNNKMPRKGFKVKPAFVIHVQLFLSAEKLVNLDKFDDSDPYC